MFKITKVLRNPRYSWYTKLKAKTKLATYSIMHELLQCQLTSVSLFNLLLMIEAGQFLWYAIHPAYTFLWDSSFAQYPRDAVKYFQLDQFFRQGDQGVFYAALYVVCVAQAIVLISIFIILVKYEENKRRSSTLVYYTLRLLSYYTLLIITIGPLPLFNTLFKMFNCTDDDPLNNGIECYKGYNLANSIMAYLALAVSVPSCFIAQLLHIDYNPASSIPFAGPQSNLGMFKLLMKVGLALYTSLDINFENQKPFIIVYSIVWLFVLLWRYLAQAYFNPNVSIYVICSEALVFWAALGTCLQSFMEKRNDDDLGVYFFLCGAPFASYTFYILFNRQRWGFMRLKVKSLKAVVQIERHLHVVCEMIEEVHHPQFRIELEGLLRYHSKSCRKATDQCICYTLASNIARMEDIQEEKKMWYQFLKSLLEESISMFPKSPRLHLQNAYFQQDRLQNRFKALYELMITEENRPDLREEFSIFHYKYSL